MGRPPCCDKANVKKGPWTPEEDAKLLAFTSTHGTGNWTTVPQRAGLKRCGKSCRLRYTNYLRPNLKHENFTQEEEDLIVTLHAMLGSRWSLIANQLPGRTDNDVKNYWNTKLSKKLRQRGIDPITHRPIADLMHSIGALAIRPPQPPSQQQQQQKHHGNTSAYLPAPAALPLVHDVAYHAAAVLPQTQKVLFDADPLASPDNRQLDHLKWSDFLADDAAAAAAEAQQYHLEEVPFHSGGGALARSGSVASFASVDSVDSFNTAPASAAQQYHLDAVPFHGGGGAMVRSGSVSSFGSVDSVDSFSTVDAGDDGAAAFIDSILDCDKETGVDQLLAELLADPSYLYTGSSSSPELDWGY